jgi:hypothetical protein
MHEGETHPKEDTLAQKKLPILGALSDEEGGYYDEGGSNAERYAEVAQVDQTTCDDPGDEDESILYRPDPRTV